MAGEVGFVELGVEDVERGRVFYGGLFPQWRFDSGPAAQGLTVGGAGVPTGMHGGDKGGGPYVFFVVDDMDAALDRVRALGGVVEEMDVEGEADTVARFGRFRLCRDDQGSPFGLHQRPTG
jgi:uncharacterized protein